MPIETARIRAFLATVEGKQQTQGYIPCDLVGGGTANYKGGPNPERYRPMGVSGVTVGTGVDLGQTDAATLVRIGV
ncbi:pesticin C-terminus-like muramidase, partial [Desulfovibrio sp. 1214_IL3152]